jgi:predicted metal-dependent enzyme (double-stranded beta helix superfamily)
MTRAVSAIAAPFSVQHRSGAGVEWLAAEIGAACEDQPERKAPRVVAALQSAAADPGLLTAGQRATCAHSYARHLLWSDPQGRFTILALVWTTGQFSPVHAHHTWCAYAVRHGDLAETLFRFDTASGQAIPLLTDIRRVGYGCFARPGFEQIHRLGNPCLERAVSIHVYGVDSVRVCSHVNRVLGTQRPAVDREGEGDESIVS